MYPGLTAGRFRSFQSRRGFPFGDHPLKVGTTQRRLAWPLLKDDTHKSRSKQSEVAGAFVGDREHEVGRHREG